MYPMPISLLVPGCEWSNFSVYWEIGWNKGGIMELDLWRLYREMLRSRRFEETVRDLWLKGDISGEMHLGIGEEAVVAGVMAHLIEGDAMALDHRGTPPLVIRGIDLVLLLKELLGRPDGLCAGMGGHMHLFSLEHLSASSGIVGAAGPMAAGFALAAQHLRKDNISVAFFGEGAMNQGMLMESMNLAAAWRLPVCFVCKDNGWAITTDSSSVTSGELSGRARGLGLRTWETDSLDVEAVWTVAKKATESTRNGEGPSFLLARCVHLEGHFLGDPLLRLVRRPLKQLKEIAGPLLGSALRPLGANVSDRLVSLGTLTALIGRATREEYFTKSDPLLRTRPRLEKDISRLERLENEVEQEISGVLKQVLPRGS